ncbi:hypothetical protein Y1Q_0022187 [Alligator mississippiensis]|uniref:Uncharacterized protein n=1 Tax=Alligator mississippiensis TaxID=8496 RepID=A0A151NZK4_ALLMI|nr:hypothetical protein Y1Q_0022187 [Alligator mississippiensis]
MTQTTFTDLLHQLQTHLEFQDTDIYQALPANTHLALVLTKLAIPASLQYVEHLFGVGEATAGVAVLEVCGIFQDILADMFLHISNP